MEFSDTTTRAQGGASANAASGGRRERGAGAAVGRWQGVSTPKADAGHRKRTRARTPPVADKESAQRVPRSADAKVLRHRRQMPGTANRQCARAFLPVCQPLFRKNSIISISKRCFGVFFYVRFKNQSPLFATGFRILCALNRQLFKVAKVDGSRGGACVINRCTRKKRGRKQWEDRKNTPRRRWARR